MRAPIHLSLIPFGVLSLVCVTGCGASDEQVTEQTHGTSDGDEVGDSGGGSAADIDEKTGLPFCEADPSARTGEPCVDEYGAVLCKTSSGFPGDELAICEPETDKGMLLHYGPSDYDNPDEVELFLLSAGGEDENCTFTHTPNPELAYVTNYRGRMRPGSHHLIVTTLDREVEDNPVPGPCSTGDTVGARWLVGSQDPQIDVAIGGGGTGDPPEAGDPDYGLAQKIGANTPLRIDMHYTNPTSETILREAWIYFDYVNESEVEDLVDMITFFQGSIDVPPQSPGETAVARCEAPTDRYVGLLTGHFHEIGTRLSVWHEKANGETTLAYETYDWADPGNLWYRDGVDNPSPSEATGQFGSEHSGYLMVKAGEALTFQCEYHNNKDHTVTLGATAKDEMCNVFGMYYPTDGNVWNCACAGDVCINRVPEGALDSLL